MKLTVTINTCMDCRHRDHSGSFTPGGAKMICGHHNVSATVLRLKPGLRDDDPNGSANIDKQCYYWKNRVIKDHDVIPYWCPLKNGCKY